MTSVKKSLSIVIALSAFLAACGKKEPEMTKEDVKSMVDEAAQKAAADATAESEKSLESKLSAGLKGLKEESAADLDAAKKDIEAKAKAEIADAKKEMEAKAKAEMEVKLAEQKEQLIKQFAASNNALRDQYNSLSSKFDSVKDKVPESVSSAFSSKLPQLNTQIGSLDSLVKGFDPSSIEQIQSFKTKYESELEIATKIGGELMKLLAGTSMGDTLSKIPGL